METPSCAAGPYCDLPPRALGPPSPGGPGARGRAGLPASAERGAESVRAARELDRLGAAVHWPGTGEAMDWGELAGRSPDSTLPGCLAWNAPAFWSAGVSWLAWVLLGKAMHD